MNFLKKTTVTLLASGVALTSLLTGCSKSDDQFVGNWKATKMTNGSQTIEDQTVLSMITLEIKADGTAEIKADDESGKCDWKSSGNTIKCTNADNPKTGFAGELNDGVLRLVEDEISIEFQK